MNYTINKQGVAGSWPKETGRSNTITRAELLSVGFELGRDVVCFNLYQDHQPGSTSSGWYANSGTLARIRYAGCYLAGHVGTRQVQNASLIEMLNAKLDGRPHTESIIAIV